MTADTQQHYVKTTDAQGAVRGREVEILQACGIDWQPGRRNHTRCPYPHHGGADDWRWDERKAKAFCTCQEGRRTDSIFDVVAKVEGLDFDASKIRCVGIVGAGNLIRQKSGDGKAGFQATDARSLLNAPAERRDDDLPRNYLGARLRIEAAHVLMPTTPTAGLIGLTYFDPPKGKGKPVAIGDFPCAVFGTVDAEGKTHAHRIYLAPGGAGKADLGQQANGASRDPKKSAKRPEGDESTAGRAVIWGDAATAPWIITAEGIETAAAVAHAFRHEIERKEVAVASPINAGGVEAFNPWPATRRVTVAADRDEASSFAKPNPSRRGERAARTFGIRNHERVAVSIAIAGAAGTSQDWLDVHEAEGPDAVRSGVLNAATFVPTDSEAQEEAQRINGLDDLAEVARLYPLPAVENMTLDYQRTQSGRILVHRYVKVGDEIEPQPLSSPFGIAARLRFADEGDTYGLRIVLQDMSSRRRIIDVDRATFARQGAAETRAMLLAAGLRSYVEGEADIVRCLKGADPQNEIAVIRRPGWSDINGVEDRFFVCPSGRVIGATGENTPELSVNSRISPSVAIGGTLEAWKAAVAAACSAPRCEHWTIGVMAGFAAPLVALCGLDTCGINLSGMTSGGKTTAQRLAVSVWSRAALDQRDSLLQSARATANGIEGMAARSNATVLALDELGHVNGKELGRIIYSLASGSGKARMTADAQLRPSHVWSTFVVLSAEKSLEEKVTGDGGEWYGGMAVRIPDIDITGVDRAVDQAVMAQIGAIDRNFGHAGPAFIEALIAGGVHQRPQEIRDGINRTAAAIAGPNADGKLIRAAIPFAILTTAGQMAKAFGLLPAGLDVPKAIRWAWGKFTVSSDAVALDPETQATANLQAWIAERWGSSIHPTERDIGERGSTRDALGWYDDAAVYIPAHRIMEAAGGTLKEIEIGRALDRQGLIAKKKDKDRFFVGFVPSVGKVKAYALSRSAFGRAGWSEPGLTLHAGGRP